MAAVNKSFVFGLVVTFSLLHGAASKCSQTDKDDYIATNLGIQCRSAVRSIVQVNNTQLSGIDYGLACSTGCMGKYKDWLLNECMDIHAANVAQISCLKENVTSPGNVIPRCRSFFPDVEVELFTSTTQCVSLLGQPNQQCQVNCKQPLNVLIDRFGCCFVSLYNNSDSIASLLEENFLDETRKGILDSFQMSGLLELCRDGSLPVACSSAPFVEGVEVSDSASNEYCQLSLALSLFLIKFFVQLFG